jgi:deleted-in-malignant-brain-tumors protein 1
MVKLDQQSPTTAISNTFLNRIGRSGLLLLAKRTNNILASDGAKRVACEVWHNTDSGVNGVRLPPCPCNIDQMNGDDRYVKEKQSQFVISQLFFKKSKAVSCYRQGALGSFSSSQQCCYDINGQLLTGIGGGSAYRVYPNNWRSFLGHLQYDVIPFFLCCEGLFKACNRFYNRRPNDNCEDWPQRPPPARLFGDPHACIWYHLMDIHTHLMDMESSHCYSPLMVQ